MMCRTSPSSPMNFHTNQIPEVLTLPKYRFAKCRSLQYLVDIFALFLRHEFQIPDLIIRDIISSRNPDLFR
jgi:hypothetical protein